MIISPVKPQMKVACLATVVKAVGCAGRVKVFLVMDSAGPV
jgi:hypothetical protein